MDSLYLSDLQYKVVAEQDNQQVEQDIQQAEDYIDSVDTVDTFVVVVADIEVAVGIVAVADTLDLAAAQRCDSSVDHLE